MSDFIPPTKEELKQHYNIQNDDFKILTRDSLPLLNRYESIEPLLWFCGVPTFILKSKRKFILAIIFIPKWGPVAADQLYDTFSVAQSVYNALHIPDMPEPQTYKYAIVTTNPITLRQHQDIAETGLFPAGTGIYPYPIT